MTANELPPRLVRADTSPARLHGEACFTCGTTDPPLHPGERVSTPGVDGVVHDWDTVVCSSHLRPESRRLGWVPDRYEVTQMPADERGRRLWGVVDRFAEDLADPWVRDEDGELVRYGYREGATQWISRQRYLTERPATSDLTRP